MPYQEANISMIAEHLRELKKHGQPVTVLLGAGASVSAGIPLASEMMSIIKQRYSSFVSVCEESYQAYMDCLPTSSRRELIGELIDKAQINYSHLYLATLIKSGYVDTVLTTNFDPLVIKALALHNEFPSVYDLSISNKYAPDECISPAVFYLHGQRHGRDLFKSTNEVNRHVRVLKKVLDDIAAQKKCWIVIGYSGKNDSVFKGLVDLKNFNNGLYWIGFNDNEPESHVLNDILDKPRTSYVKGYDADSFFLELATELGLSKPQIIDKPFSFLQDSINMISQYKKEEKLTDLTKEAKSWIQIAIEGFEAGHGFDDLKTRIETNTFVGKVRDIWIYEKYNEIASIQDKVVASNNVEAKEYLAYAYCNMGKNYFKSKHYDISLECYNKALDLKPDDYETIKNMGNIYLSLEKYDDAIECYNKIIDLKQDDSEVLYNMGNVYVVLKQHAKVFECYNKALNLRPDYYDALKSMGNAYSELNQYDKAIEYYTKTLSIRLDDHEVLNNIGSAYSNLKQYAKAIEYYIKALNLNAENPKVLNNMGNAYSELKQYEKALDCYSQAFELKSDNYNILYNMGNVYSELKQYEKAIDCYDKVLDLKSDYPDALYNMGIVYSEVRQYEKALDCYNQALNLKSDDPKALYNMGNVYFDLKQYDKAIECYNYALDSKIDESEALYDTETVCSDLTQYANTVEHLDYKPNYSEVLNNMGSAYYRLKQYERAIECYNKSLELKSDYPEVLNNMGSAYSLLKQYDKALECFNKALELKPDYPEVLCNMGNVYSHMKQHEKAINVTTRLLSLNQIILKP